MCDQLVTELNTAMIAFDADDEIGAVVITGSEKAFAGNLFYITVYVGLFDTFYSDLTSLDFAMIFCVLFSWSRHQGDGVQDLHGLLQIGHV